MLGKRVIALDIEVMRLFILNNNLTWYMFCKMQKIMLLDSK